MPSSRPLRIGFNALCAENKSGTGRYAAELILALARIDRRNRYFVRLNADSPLRGPLSAFDNVELYPTAAAGTLRRLLFERFRLPAWIREKNLDLFHSPAFIAPRHCPTRSVVTIHDLVFRLFPETVPALKRLHYNRSIPASIRGAALILADSHSTARDLQNIFAVPAAKIRVVHLGVSEEFFAPPDPARQAELRERHALPDRFILTAGTLEPRKNLPALLQAYARLIQETSPGNADEASAHGAAAIPDLVITGRTGWGGQDLPRLLEQLGITGRVHLTGFVTDADLRELYRMAALFACVSLYEGFGLPVLEAMACGAPVVAADNSSIPEVVGDTAPLANARAVEDIAAKIRTALADPAAAMARAQAARERARAFSWTAAAEKTLAAYESLFTGENL